LPEPDVGFPERLTLEILGSRKPILFVEGERESLDSFIFSKLSPGRTVIPCGNADAVIHATKSFARHLRLHNSDCIGVVDRDFRSHAEVDHLRRFNVFCLNVSEVENLFLEEEVLRAVASALLIADPDRVVAEAKAKVFKLMEACIDNLISRIVAARIEERFAEFDAKAVGREGIKNAFDVLAKSINVAQLFEEVAATINGIIARQDYRAALQIYNNKGLLAEVSSLFGSTAAGFRGYVNRLLASKDNSLVVEALRSATRDIAW